MKNEKVRKSLIFLLYMVIGAFASYKIGYLIGGTSTTEKILALLLLCLFFVLHVFLHEGGHLLFGLLTGHKFLSFRIFSYCLVLMDGKFKLTKIKVPGTLGQCLMIPPKMENDHFPFRLYLLGGGILNILASLVSLLFFSLSPLFVIEFALLGIILGISNLIPYSFNDGTTYQLTKSSKENERLLYLQLASNAKLTSGLRFSELSESYYEIIPANPKYTYFNDFQLFLILGRRIELKEWEEARELFENFWKRRENLILPYQLELKKEFISFLLVTETEDMRIELLIEDKQLQNYLKSELISNKRVLAIIQWYYYQNEEESLRLINEGFSLENQTSSRGEFLIEADMLSALKEQIDATNLLVV